MFNGNLTTCYLYNIFKTHNELHFVYYTVRKEHFLFFIKNMIVK
jgi:hypothetical protein